MSTIELPDIVEYAAGFKRPLRKGALLAKSRTHFFGFGRLTTNKEGSSHFVSACLTHKVKAGPHTVNVWKTNHGGEVQLKGTCTCKANSTRCKHIIGFMLKLERLSLSEIPVFSKTDVAQEWGQVNQQRLKAEKPSRFLDLCHVKEKVMKYKLFPSVLPTQIQEGVTNDILAVFPHSIAYKAIHALNTVIPKSSNVDNEIPYSRILQAPFESDTSCINIDEDVLFQSYTSQTDEDIIYFYHDYVDVIKQKAVALCKLTRYQNTRRWRAERQIRITASSAYPLYTYIKTPKSESQWQNKLETVIVRKWGGNKHTEFGKAKEEFTKKFCLTLA